MLKFEVSNKPIKPSSNEFFMIILSKNKLLYDTLNNRVFFTIKDLPFNYDLDLEKLIYIGKLNEKEIFALDDDKINISSDIIYLHARSLLDRFNRTIHQIIFRSLHLQNWHKNSQYCSCCGAQAHLSSKEFVKICSNKNCNYLLFPQYSPAIIVLVSSGDRILLGRSPHFEKGMYSTLAGFIEAGETCEDAVRRELMEEVGIQVKNIQHHSVQPWPFPNSLMLGYTAEYKSGILTVNKDELEDAQWFHIDNLPTLPIKSSIASELINDFINMKRTATKNSASDFSFERPNLNHYGQNNLIKKSSYIFFNADKKITENIANKSALKYKERKRYSI